MKLFLIALVFVIGCDKRPTSENPEGAETAAAESTKKSGKTEVAYSCEYTKKISCREHDVGSYASLPDDEIEANIKTAITDCEAKGNVARRGPCPDKYRKLICHMSPHIRTMSANPKWEKKKPEERKYWCPIGKLEDRF